MTRKGKRPIQIPKGVDVKTEGEKVVVKGPKGELKLTVREGIVVRVENGVLTVRTESNRENLGKFHGLYHSLLKNMLIGTSTGFQKELEMIGVGYRAAVQGRQLNLQVGFSHPTLLDIPASIEVEVQKNTKVIVRGVDKQETGEFAASIRRIRPPEPYKGKGIRYVDEFVRRKAGKSAAKK